MKYCSQCRTEYEDWAIMCSDCQNPLVNTLPLEIPKEKRKRPREITILAGGGFVMAVFLFILFFPFAIFYAITIFKLLELHKKARSAFLGFSIFLMAPFLVTFFVLIWALLTGEANDHNGATGGWLLGFSIVFFPLFLYHLVSSIYLTRPKVKELFK